MSLEKIFYSCRKAVKSLAITSGFACYVLCMMFVLTSCTHNTPNSYKTFKQLEFKPNSEKLHYTVGIKVPKHVGRFVYSPKTDTEPVWAELGLGLRLNAHRAFADYFDKVTDMGDTNITDGVDYVITFEFGKVENSAEWKDINGTKRLVSVELIGVASDRAGKEVYRRNGVGKVECVRWECKSKNDAYSRNEAGIIAQSLFLGLNQLQSNVDDMIQYTFEASLKEALDECRMQLIRAIRNT